MINISHQFIKFLLGWLDANATQQINKLIPINSTIIVGIQHPELSLQVVNLLIVKFEHFFYEINFSSLVFKLWIIYYILSFKIRKLNITAITYKLIIDNISD